MAIPLRSDFDATALRAAARRTKDAAQGRRLLALATVYDGGRRTEAARIGGVTLQIVRDWVLKFNVHGPAGLIEIAADGLDGDTLPFELDEQPHQHDGLVRS